MTAAGMVGQQLYQIQQNISKKIVLLHAKNLILLCPKSVDSMGLSSRCISLTTTHHIFMQDTMNIVQLLILKQAM